MTITPSLILSASCFCISVVLLTFQALLLWLCISSLAMHSGRATEVVCTVMYIIAAITLLAEEIYFLYRHKTPPSYKRRLIIIGIVWACISAAAIVVTVDAARSPGLIQDFSAESDSYTTGISLLALSWLAFLLTSMLAMLTFVNGLLVMPVNALPDGSYTGANPRHKVVFHKDMKPLKVIELSQGRDEAALGYGNNQYVQPPQPVHTAWAERYPGQIKTTYNHWPGDFA